MYPGQSSSEPILRWPRASFRGFQPDAGAGSDALQPYESLEPADPDLTQLIQEFVKHSRYDASPSGRGWQVVIPLRLDRRQAVYAGRAGTDAEGRAILMLVSVCGPVKDRDCRALLKLNGRSVEGHSPFLCFAPRSISWSSRISPPIAWPPWSPEDSFAG
jgi:hypothetical protein